MAEMSYGVIAPDHQAMSRQLDCFLWGYYFYVCSSVLTSVPGRPFFWGRVRSSAGLPHLLFRTLPLSLLFPPSLSHCELFIHWLTDCCVRTLWLSENLITLISSQTPPTPPYLPTLPLFLPPSHWRVSFYPGFRSLTGMCVGLGLLSFILPNTTCPFPCDTRVFLALWEMVQHLWSSLSFSVLFGTCRRTLWPTFATLYVPLYIYHYTYVPLHI